MKKIFLYLFTVLCTLSFFTACSDDDDKDQPIDTTWQSVSGTYKAETLILNGTEGKATSTETIKVDATSAEAASVVLGNIVIGEPEVKLDAKLAKAADESYTLTGENSTADRVVSVQGSVKDGKLTVTASVKITAPVVGVWKLKIADNSADVMVNIETPDGSGAMMSGMIKTMLGPVIASKVKSVTVTYAEDGKLGIDFETTTSDGNAEMAKGIISLLDPRYYVQTTDGNSQLYIAVNKGLLEMGGAVMGEEMMAALKGLLVDAGNYYALPINVKVEDNYAQFYMSKDLILKAMPIILPLISSSIPEEYLPMLQGLQAATVLDFGLGFTK
ncbi:hypothetical protein [Parabacteroides sp.]